MLRGLCDVCACALARVCACVFMYVDVDARVSYHAGFTNQWKRKWLRPSATSKREVKAVVAFEVRLQNGQEGQWDVGDWYKSAR